MSYLPQNFIFEEPDIERSQRAELAFDSWTKTDRDVIVEVSKPSRAIGTGATGLSFAKREVEGDENSFIPLSPPTALKTLIGRLQRELREGF